MKYLSVIIIALFCKDACSQSCTTPLGRSSECISIYECSELMDAFQLNPLPTAIVSFLRKSQCGFNGNTPKVCCGPIPPQTPTTTRPRTTRAPFVNNESGGTDPAVDEDSSPAPRGTCGIDQNGDRIYGGQITDIDEFPWMALLGYRTRTNNITYQCGGALINHRYVVTAAHCVVGAIEREVGTLVTVRLGEYDTLNDIDCLDDSCADPVQEIPVEAAYPHEEYNDRSKNRYHDIAVIKLARRAKYSYFVQPVCLVERQSRVDGSSNFFVAGWGSTLNGKKSNVKQKLGLPGFDKSDCGNKYRSLGVQLGDGQVCAGGVFAKDSCKGDSGGPLMKRLGEGVWETIGVVSFGYGCGRDGWPGVYTAIGNYIDWIKNTLRSTNN